MKRMLLICLVLLLALGGGGLWWARHDPRWVPLPEEPDTMSGRAVETYLAGDGKNLLRFEQAIPRPVHSSAADQCAGLSTALQRVAGPRRLAALAGSVPDAALSGQFNSLLSTTVHYLKVCRSRGDSLTVGDRVDDVHTVLERLLEQRGGQR